MSELANIVVYGAAGRMGQAVIRCVSESARARLAAALVRPGPMVAGEPQGGASAIAPYDVEFDTPLNPAAPCDAVIDFSSPLAFDAALALAVQRRAAFVSGTTGLSDAQHAALDHAARTIPVLWASNFSLGVAMLARLARHAAEALLDWDCEIVEMHHARKQDAPSGTALTLGAAVAEGRKIALDDHARYERHGQIGARPQGEIGFATVRGGDVVGEHTAFFAGEGERIELTHRATNRDIFARGALAAAIWLSGRAPGQYRIEDVLSPG